MVLGAHAARADGPAEAAGAHAAPPRAATAERRGIEALLLPAQVRFGRAGSRPGLGRLRARLDALLADTAQDLGLTVDLGEPAVEAGRSLGEHELGPLAE
ncbi:MAG: hypothetical protein HY744_31560, partial [Deltaproteobacteria bacterium]|nr:hypothetical protein [Deltaproteobacteria bacterium]